MATLLRNEITSFCATLDPSVDEVLYAAFYGDKPQAPVHIYWTIDLGGWDHLRSKPMELFVVGALIWLERAIRR